MESWVTTLEEGRRLVGALDDVISRLEDVKIDLDDGIFVVSGFRSIERER